MATTVQMVIDSVRKSVSKQRVVILKEARGKRYLPIWVGDFEADQIALKMQDVSLSRPFAHDLLCKAFKLLNTDVKMLLIDELQNDTFFAKLVLTTKEKEYQLDCRPSDGIAVAVRANAPIFVENSILNKAGILFVDGKALPAVVVDDKTLPAATELSKSPELRPEKIAAFSDTARQVLSLSDEEAKRVGAKCVRTEHMLKALACYTRGMAAKVLEALEVDLEVQLAADAASKEHGEDGEVGLSSNVKKVLEFAVEEARRLADNSISTEHLLLALIREQEGTAAKILESLSVGIEAVLTQLLRLRKLPPPSMFTDPTECQ